MQRFKKILSFFCILFLIVNLSACGGGGGNGDPDPVVEQRTGAAAGIVSNTVSGEPLSNVTVSSGGRSTQTNSNGEFVL